MHNVLWGIVACCVTLIACFSLFSQNTELTQSYQSLMLILLLTKPKGE